MPKEASGPTEIPFGNRWSFDNRNTFLTPENFSRLPTDTGIPPGLSVLLSGLSRAINIDWRIEDVLYRDSERRGRFVVVCTNPLRTELSPDQPPITDFIREEFLEPIKDPALNPITRTFTDPYFEGTNYDGEIHAVFNDVVQEKREGIFRRKKNYVYYQTGVAYIDVYAETLDHKIEMEELGLRTFDSPGFSRGAHRRILEYERRKVVNPRKLFPD